MGSVGCARSQGQHEPHQTAQSNREHSAWRAAAGRGWSRQPGEGSSRSINAEEEQISVHRLAEMGVQGSPLCPGGQERAGCLHGEWDNAELCWCQGWARRKRERQG